MTGGIAAYKAPALARLLAEHARVRVVMTRAARRFVGPLTFTAITGQHALTDMFDPGPAGPMAHIHEAGDADLFVVAPATADFIARAAAGRADDLLGAMLLVTRAPVVVAPAMNVRMWEHPATQRNLALLRTLARVHLVGPVEGDLACGWSGKGRMADPEEIHARALELLRGGGPLEGKTVIVTSGPTEEPVDPVRVITNRSSGRMGRALAEQAKDRGARVVLVRGPVQVADPAGVQVVLVRTTLEMCEAVLERLPGADVLLMAAAVADYRPAPVSLEKLRQAETGDRWSLDLVRTEDVLSRCVAARKGPLPVIVGFSLETDPERAVGAARAKLRAKGCDLVVGNLAGTGLGGDASEVTLVAPRARPVRIGPAPKTEIAGRILDWVEKRI